MDPTGHSTKQQVLAAVAARQHGCFTFDQARSAGYSSAAVTRGHESGSWVRRTSGVYSFAGAPEPWRSDVMAAVLGVPGSHASHRTAARLHGVGYVPRSRIEITAERHGNHEESLADVHELRDVAAADLTTVDGIPVTTLPRTVVDLAAVLRWPRLERVLDDALVRHLVTVDEVHGVLRRVARRGKPGIRPLRALLGARVAGLILPTSELERRFYRLLDDSPLPAFDRQWKPPWWDGTEGIVDAAWPRHRLIVEADGRQFHTRDADFEKDAERTAIAAAHGYGLIRFTWEQVNRRGLWVVTSIGSALEHAAA